MVYPLPMQITVRLLVMVYNPQNHKRRDNLDFTIKWNNKSACMVSPLPMQITVRLLVVRHNPQNNKRRNNLDFTIKRNNKSLWSVSFTDANNGTAVGVRWTILKTTNGGVTFIEEKKII